MNKLVIVAVAFAVVAVSAQGPDDRMKNYLEKCKTEEGATDDDLNALMKNLPLTDKGYCVLGCINKKTGVVGADNKMNLEKAQQEMARLKELNPGQYDKTVAIMQTCKTEVESNSANLATTCSVAKAHVECMNSKMKL